MPLLSVITAAWAPSARFITEARESLFAERLPAGWELEWIVQEDGEHPHLHEVVGDDPRTRYGANHIRAGVAGTRNLALARARGDWIRVLDQDSLIFPEGLEHQLERIGALPEISWVGGLMHILREDGQTEADHSSDIPEGQVEPGWVMDEFARRPSFPLWCGNLVMRSTMVRALGGWGALPRSDDLLLVGALSELVPGYWLPREVGVYRCWAGQDAGTPAWHRQRELAWSAVYGRVRAMAAVGLSFDGAPAAGRTTASTPGPVAFPVEAVDEYALPPAD